MYFAYGWPKVLAALEPGAKQEEVVYLHADAEYFVLVSTSRIQLWTGGQHRVKLGTFTREPASIQAEGLNRKAFWSSVKRSLAVLTYHNVLHVYGMHTASESVLGAGAALGGPGEALEFRRVDIYLQQAQSLGCGAASACDLVGDGRSLLLGLSDGTLQLYSWQAKLRAQLAPFSHRELARLEGQRVAAAARRASFEAREQRAGSGELRARAGGSGQLAKLARSSSTLSRSSSQDRLPHARSASGEEERPPPGVDCLDYCPRLQLLAAALSDGRCALLRTGGGSLGGGEGVEPSHWLCGPGTPATVVRLSAAAQLAALGLASGEVALHRLWGPPGGEPLRTISLAEWGYEPEAVGSVSDLQWAPDGRALAVGWRRSGLGIWSPAGCRLMCTLRQAGGGGGGGGLLRQPSSGGAPGGSGWQQVQGLEGGVSVLAWGVHGYSLLVAESASVAQVMEVTLAKGLPASHRLPQPDAGAPGSSGPQELYFLLADDRLLQICEASGGGPGGRQPQLEGAPDLAVQHLKPPPAYVAANWPLRLAALSSDGVDLAVAGKRGLALFSRRSARWRLFGDVSQERGLTVHALLWLPRMVLVCASQAGSPAAASLLLFPRYHLDNASLLASFPLDQVPLAVDALGCSVVVALPPLEVRLLRVDLAGALTPLGTPTAAFRVVRELSMMTVGQPLRSLALVQLPPPPGRSPEPKGAGVAGPQHCVLLRAGGALSVLDMELGSEASLAEDVECFWLPGAEAAAAAAESRALAAAMDAATSLDTAPSRGELRAALSGMTVEQTPRTSPAPAEIPAAANGTAGGRADSGRQASTSGRSGVEVPWWVYGARGMQLWFPSSLAEPVSPGAAAGARGSGSLATDPELEFDREVYPIGVSLAEVAIIGVTQRVARAAACAQASSGAPAHARLPLFQVVPETQPVLPCLLRRLLQQRRLAEAEALAAQHAGAPHFARSLEWLLFTSLELDADAAPSPAKLRAAGRPPPRTTAAAAGPLLSAAAELLRRFPQAGEIVVSVARKTDAALWPALFAAVGQPSDTLEGLLEAGQLRGAACCLVIVDRLQGPAAAAALCLRLIRVAVSEGQYELVADLLRFIVPPGEDSLLVGLPRAEQPVPLSPPPGAAAGLQQPPRQQQQQPPQKGWLASWFSGARSDAAPERSTQQQQPAPAAANGTAEAEERGAWGAAYRLVGHHAWRLLDQGRLRAAAALGRALLDAGASLPGLLLACRAGAREGLPTARACLAALLAAEREFPVAADRQAALDAALVKEACQAASAWDWTVALALLLDDTAALAEVRWRQPGLWAAVAELVAADARAAPYAEAAAAVSAAPQPGPVA